MNSLIVPPVARVVLPCSVNERLRSKDVARASALYALSLALLGTLPPTFLAIAALMTTKKH